MDNSAIERIATPDLANDVLALLNTYGANDEIVFLLGRFVWQGQMTNCATALLNIAGDSARGSYARIMAIRGVMAVGNEGQKARLWEAIAEHPGALDRAVLAELVDWVPPTTHGVKLVLGALRNVAPIEQFNSSGLRHSLHLFIDRLPVMDDSADDHPLGRLLEGFNEFLEREPFIERGECFVSEEFAWLMSPALHAVDRLVAARSSQAFSLESIAVMRNTPALRFWRSDRFDEYKTSLEKNVSRWRELNDHLYWNSIRDGRAKLAHKGQPLLDDWQVAFAGHLWKFGPEDFERCVEWVQMKDGDDRLVALSRCIQIYVEADRPAEWLTRLQATVRHDEMLTTTLDARLNPKLSPSMERMEAEHRRWVRKTEKEDRKEKKNRADWVRVLKENPDRVIHPPNIEPGEISHDQYLLIRIMMDKNASTNGYGDANWRTLTAEFGEAVARAYRDAAVAHWRAYRPRLRSEGAEANSTPYSLIFAMIGLAIESDENSAFADRLTQEEAQLAFRYVTCELNGFPDWFEPLYRSYPIIGHEVVIGELLWELENSVVGQPLHYILHDIVYHAPWMHVDVSLSILDWLETHDMPHSDGLRYCLNILVNGGVSPKVLADLAAKKIKGQILVEQKPRWFALWVDNDPNSAIPALEMTLAELASSEAATFAQQFAVGLLGDRHGSGPRTGGYRNAVDLKSLYLLMHRYIPVREDIERANKGVYSPTLRDDAQHARDTLFNMLVQVPGADTYTAIKALAAEHPEPAYRGWMVMRARERATMDADEPLWTLEQVIDFLQVP